MIVDHISNAYLYENIGKGVKAAFDFIRATDFSKTPAGKHELDGERMYYLMNVYETAQEDTLKYEAHKKYIDIQFVVQGEEYFGWNSLNKMQVNEVYQEEKEVAFFEGSGFKIPAQNNHFYILFPNDVHKPNVVMNTPIPMRKVVIKVRLDYALEK